MCMFQVLPQIGSGTSWSSVFFATNGTGGSGLWSCALANTVFPHIGTDPGWKENGKWSFSVTDWPMPTNLWPIQSTMPWNLFKCFLRQEVDPPTAQRDFPHITQVARSFPSLVQYFQTKDFFFLDRSSPSSTETKRGKSFFRKRKILIFMDIWMKSLDKESRLLWDLVIKRILWLGKSK